MASNWYVSSVDYAAVAQWAAVHTYAVGNIVRQLAAPAVNSERCFRCTAITTGVSGASEPSWNLGDSATTSETTVTWTECTGQQAHQRDNGATVVWTAPAARVGCLMFFGKASVASGDTIFLSSDHAETQSAAALNIYSASSAGGPPCNLISVTKTGSVPCVAADITNGASMSATGANNVNINRNLYAQGITFSGGSGSSAGYISFFSDSNQGQVYLKNCSLVINTTASTCYILMNSVPGSVTLDNTPITFGATGHVIYCNQGVDFTWVNTPSALGGSIFPTTLFNVGTGTRTITCRGVDLSALGSGKTIYAGGGDNLTRAVFENCKLNASVTLISGVNSNANDRNVKVDFINCDSGATGYRNEWHRQEGDITTETTITRASGASDGVQAVSWKAISSGSSAISPTLPLEFPPIAVWNTLTGSAHTATIELISSASLNNNDIWVDLEYLGSSGSPLGSGVNSLPATVLTTAAACPTSSKTWNSSPASPVKQYLQVSFTAQLAGLVVARVKIAKPATTVYVDPLITIV